MPLLIQPSTPHAPVYEKFTPLPEREPGEQQHGFPFPPPRLPEALLVAHVSEEIDESVSAAKGDDDVMSQDINAIAPEANS